MPECPYLDAFDLSLVTVRAGLRSASVMINLGVQCALPLRSVLFKQRKWSWPSEDRLPCERSSSSAWATSRRHIRVLERIAEAEVVAGVDPAPRDGVVFRGRVLPIHRTVREAADKHRPSLVVIATPTPTHGVVHDEVVEHFPAAEVLLEKPAADNVADASRMLAAAPGKTLNVAYHAAVSSEVSWARRLVREKADMLGAPSAIRAIFADPYQSNIEAARARYGTSWLDSGINALSVISRFVDVAERTSLRSLEPEGSSVFEGRFRCQSGTSQAAAVVVTNWRVTAPTKTTLIEFAAGAELIMDHYAVAGYLLSPEGTVVDAFGGDGRTPRRELHYRNLYRAYYRDRAPIFSPDESRRLHELLFPA